MMLRSRDPTRVAGAPGETAVTNEPGAHAALPPIALLAPARAGAEAL